ncbi:Conserved_hypothetical protein [Hexamita inflata]|uniref:Uncharacterized protein n=2 Tax=Hexamita inflata TaxID=28002 RepID=A0AA86N786_9EUKA|nr:Conserved hypothetical protein [Hexamita inflata]
MMTKIPLPPNNSEVKVRLPGLVHTQHTFIRPFVQTDYKIFTELIKKHSFQSRFENLQLDQLLQLFVNILNSYKQDPFILLAVCHRETFEPVGMLSISQINEGELEFILECENFQLEIMQGMCDYYSAYNLDFVTHQGIKNIQELGFVQDERKLFVKKSERQ